MNSGILSLPLSLARTETGQDGAPREVVRQLSLSFPVRAASGREDFFVSRSNAAAVRWLDSYPAWPTPALYLWGEAGSGKSHLAQIFAGATDCRVAEDIDRGGAGSDEDLLHLYNATAEAGGHLLVTARRPVGEFARLPDLLSRLKACVAARIEPPDDDLLRAVLLKQLTDRQLPVSPEVLAYAADRIERSFAAAVDLAARADEMATSRHRRLTVPLIRELLTV
ncbi:regulatory inactivation of DnaA Hda protein [Alphaproteobacteria bacterium]|nr:regulatory inactivation of DnaA Hda protein [Alphaproteobacteria bacterium]